MQSASILHMRANSGIVATAILRGCPQIAATQMGRARRFPPADFPADTSRSGGGRHAASAHMPRWA